MFDYSLLNWKTYWERVYRFSFRFKRPIDCYPVNIKAIHASIDQAGEIVWSLPAYQEQHPHKKEQIQVEQLKIATRFFPISHEIPWNHSFDDVEDTVSLHRWHWLVYALSQRTKRDFDALTDWGTRHIDSWISESLTFKNHWIWEPYTVAERVVSWILFVHLSGLNWPERWSKTLQSNVQYIIDHLEYKGRYTGNHVFNNARAIYIAGATFAREDWKEMGREIIKYESKRLLTPDGFLNDGSSHYHFLFTRWVLEILYFSQLSNDEDFTAFVKPMAHQAVERCWFFLVFDEKTNQMHLPLFGDISPDCFPQWLWGLPWSSCAKAVYRPLHQQPSNGDYGWIRLFAPLKELQDSATASTTSEIESYPQSGWHKMRKSHHVLIWHLEQKTPDKCYSHAHCDLGGFYFFLDGQPVLVDSGLLNYQVSSLEWDFANSSQAHNAILINNQSVYPVLRRRFPERYPLPQSRLDFEYGQDKLRAILEYQGYEQTGSLVEVERHFSLTEDSLLISDQIKGRGQKKVTLMYHFAPGIECFIADRNCFTIALNDKIIKGRFSSTTKNAKVDIRLHPGADKPMGSVVDSYGHRQKACVMEVLVQTDLPCRIDTLLNWGS